jgi:hypothetical protein
MKKLAFLAVCFCIFLVGCDSVASPVIVDNGRFATQDKTASFLGYNEAMQRLSREIHANPAATQFTIKWHAAYPGGGPDAETSEVIEYDSQAGTLVNEPFHYNGVTNEMIDTLAARSQAGTGSAMPEDLPKLGATEESTAPK